MPIFSGSIFHFFALVRTVRMLAPYDNRQSGKLQQLVDRIAHFRKPPTARMQPTDYDVTTIFDDFPILAKL